MNVLVIPEDFRKDQYMLKPIVEAMMKQAGKERVIVEVCTDPLLGGIVQALRWERIEEIIERYKWRIDLFLLCVDRDGVSARRARLDQIEAEASTALGHGKTLLAENAWQEIEVWVLAGHDDLPATWQWKAIREETDPKEAYFLPYSKQRGLLGELGEGRRRLALEAARRYDRIRKLCPEDVAALEARIAAWLGGQR
jgi:hypothetical protein